MNEIILPNTQLKNYLSVDTTFKPENLSGPAKMKAATEIKDIISPEVYALAVAHVNSENFGSTDNDRFKLLNQLVELIQGPFVNFTMYYQFVWLSIRASSNTLSVLKSDTETSLNKGERIEAKESLLEYAWSYINELIDFLNTNSENITDKYGADAVKIWETSSQYTETQHLIFDGHRDFGRYYGIDNCAAFYYRCRTLIQTIVEENVEPRNIPDKPDIKLIRALKYAIAFETVARACSQMPVSSLPSSIRQAIDKEGYGNAKEADTITNKVAKTLFLQAENAWAKVDIRLAEVADDGEGNIIIVDNAPKFDETKSHASIL